jgi:hypothetical protein
LVKIVRTRKAVLGSFSLRKGPLALVIRGAELAVFVSILRGEAESLTTLEIEGLIIVKYTVFL